MTLLSKYLSKEIAKIFLYVITLIIGIFIAVDYLGTMDEFIDAGISLQRAFIYVILKIPFIITQVLPVALLLSTLVVFGLMSKHNEIVIIRSSGISIFYLLRTLVVMGLLFSLLLVFLAEIAVPISMAKSNAIQQEEIRKNKTITAKGKNIWIKGKRKIIHIAVSHPAEKALYGITCYQFDSKFNLVRRIDAHKGVYADKQWTLENVMVQQFDPATGTFISSFPEQLVQDIGLVPEDLKKVAKPSTEMTFMELLANVRKIEAEGYNAARYRVDLYAKTAYPFSCMIMVLIGTGLAARGKLAKGLPTSITIGLLIAFFYWVFNSFCISLGYGERLPAILAAWSANAVFLCVGAISLVNAE